MDLSNQLKLIDIEIKISKSKIDEIENKSKVLIEKIRKFKDTIHKDCNIEFRYHGSYVSKTILKPKDINDTYDIDLGVYIKNDKIHSSKTYKNRLFEIVVDHTNLVENRNKCIRVTYEKGENKPNFHVDLTLMFPYNSNYHLCTNSEFIESNSTSFIIWLNNKFLYNDNLKKMIRLLKWSSKIYPKKLPSGLVFTILVCNNHQELNHLTFIENFTKTIERIYRQLKLKFVCNRPTYPIEDLLINSDLRYDLKSNTLDFLKDILDSLHFILDTDDYSKAYNELQRRFGV